MSNKCCSDVVFSHALSALRVLVRTHHFGIRSEARASSSTSSSLVPIAPVRDKVFSDLSTRSATQHFQRTANSACDPCPLPRPVSQASNQPDGTSIEEWPRRAPWFQVSRLSVPRILHSDRFSRFTRSFTNRNRSSTCFMRPRPNFECWEIVAVLSEYTTSFRSTLNSFATAQMKSPSHAPLPRAYPSASADDKAGDPCVRL